MGWDTGPSCPTVMEGCRSVTKKDGFKKRGGGYFVDSGGMSLCASVRVACL